MQHKRINENIMIGRILYLLCLQIIVLIFLQRHFPSTACILLYDVTARDCCSFASFFYNKIVFN